jgi:hypothetical protein
MYFIQLNTQTRWLLKLKKAHQRWAFYSFGGETPMGEPNDL